MGAWGPGNFENDTALDWLGERPTGASLAHALRGAVADDSEACERCLAAAEMVAAWNGHPLAELPAAADAVRLRGFPNAELVAAARERVTAIAEQSELAMLWSESSEHAAWVAVQRDLLDCLGRPATKRSTTKRKRTPEPRPSAVLYLEVPTAGFSTGTYHPFRATGLPRLPAPGDERRALARVPRVDVELGMDFTDDELERISDWLAESPHVVVGLSDVARVRGYRHEPARLARFSRARTLSLFLERAPDLRFLETFRELESLIVVRLKCALELPASLRRLLVHTAPVPDLRGWGHLTQLEDLRLPHPASEHLDVLPALRFVSVGVGDLDALARLPLQALELRGVVAHTDLAPLARSTTIRFLSLHVHTSEQTAAIARLPLRNLRVWIPEHASPELVEALRGHPTLERVMVSGFGWQRISGALREMGFANGEMGDWPTD